MRYHVLATDYDGTLAHNGRVDEPTIAALRKLVSTGRRLVMVTGRELPQLLAILPEIELFEWIVAENGGLLYCPASKEEIPLAEPPPKDFIPALAARGVAEISVGRVIVATWEPYEKAVLETIQALGLEMQVIFNKGAVMVLPAGVNKASGLKAALKKMGISPHNVVGVGDAENDHSFLRMCECSVAVANALAAVKDTADLATFGDHGAGVTQLAELLIADDLAECEKRLVRHDLALGKSDGQEVLIPAYGPNVLICGASGSGKSTVAKRIIEAVHERGYQFCIIDPEGDYEVMQSAVVFGGPKAPPLTDEVLKLLEDPKANAVVCMTGMPIGERPTYFLGLLSQLLQMRTRTGRPHWLILDEAHHLMPKEWLPPQGLLPEQLLNLVLITVHADLLSPALLQRIDTVLSVGADAAATLDTFAKAAKVNIPAMASDEIKAGELLMWQRDGTQPPIKVQAYPSESEHHRHRRKYAEGELPPDRSFYFRGPEKKLNLRAQNLMLFLQLADGVDDETWAFHLARGDYARWFRDDIKDEGLGGAADEIAKRDADPQESRALIREAIERDYTLPATSPKLPVPGAS